MRQDPKIDAFIPLSAGDTYVLSILLDGVRHGYAIMTEAEKRAHKKIFAGTTSLYRSLDKMCGSGLLEEFTDLHDGRRRYFKITARGVEALKQQRDWMKSMVGVLDIELQLQEAKM